MDAHEEIVTQLIAQLQTYIEDLRAGQPMNRTAALQLGALLPELRTVVANRLITIGILCDDERSRADDAREPSSARVSGCRRVRTSEWRRFGR
jgi:hypothetical protein